MESYYLDCGTSETLWHRSCPDCEMGYYLNYGTSETKHLVGRFL